MLNLAIHSKARLWKDLLAKLDGRQSMGDHPDRLQDLQRCEILSFRPEMHGQEQANLRRAM